MCHCESGNIWTHLLAALYFLVHLMLIIIRCCDLHYANAAKKLAGDGDTMKLADVIPLNEATQDAAVPPESRDLSTQGNGGTMWSVLSGPGVNPYY